MAAKTQTKPTPADKKTGLPIVPIVLGVVAVALVVAVIVTGSEPLGGSEFGEPSITGTALPSVLDYNPPDAPEDPAFGMTIPEVSGQDFTGNTVEIKNDGQAKAILFVSHSCPHCQDEVPEVQAWIDSGGGVDGVEMISVSTAASSARGNWPPSEWLEGAGWTVPVIADDTDLTAFSAYGGIPIPYWVFVDADGTVTRRNVGRMEIPALQAAMLETLG